MGDKDLHKEEGNRKTILSKLCAKDTTLQRITLCQSWIILGHTAKKIGMTGHNSLRMSGERGATRFTTDAVVQSNLNCCQRERIVNYWRGFSGN